MASNLPLSRDELRALADAALRAKRQQQTNEALRQKIAREEGLRKQRRINAQIRRERQRRKQQEQE